MRTILHAPPPRPPPLLHQHPHPSRIRPVPRVRLPGLKYRLQSQQLHRVDDFPRQGVLDRLLGAHAAAFGARFAGVEVEGVEALVVLVFGGWGLRGLLVGRAGLVGGRAGWGVGGGADEGVGEVGGVLFGGVGVAVGEFFDAGVLGHGGCEEEV